MTIQQRLVGPIAVLDLDGRLVLGDGDAALTDTVSTLVSEGRRQLVLNLGNVAYVDSSGLGALVTSTLTARNAGGTIKLFNVTKRVYDLLAIAKLLSLFDVCDTEADALREFGAAV